MTEAQFDYAELHIADERLIAAVRDGDTSAFATLYERHADAARALARQLVRSQAEVDDIVSECFARVLSVLQRDGGPRDAFRPYLLTALRHVAYDRSRGDTRQVVTDTIEKFDRGEPFVDPALEGLERSLIARAFRSLPERWQAVLWHTEIEGTKPAEVAPLLGVSANGAAALAYRAREGLRQAYLQMHLASGAPAESCRPSVDRLGAYVRGGLAKRETRSVDAHLDECADCRAVYAELMDINVGLRGIVGPLVAGSAAAGYLAALPSGVLVTGFWRRLPRRQQQVVAAGVAAAAIAAALGLVLVSSQDTVPSPDDPGVAGAPDPAGSDQPAGPGGGSAGDGSGDGAVGDGADGDGSGASGEAGADGGDPGGADRSDTADRANPADRPGIPGRPGTPAALPAVPPAFLPPQAAVPPPSEEAARGAPLLYAAIESVGSLVPGRSGIVAIEVGNTGTPVSADVHAEISLPAGIRLSGRAGGSALPGGAHVEGGGWACETSTDGGTCVRPGLDTDEAATGYLTVHVDQDAATGEPLGIAASADEATTSGTSSNGVDPAGTAARYATQGRVRAEAVGNALLTCTDTPGGRPGRPGWPAWPPWSAPQPGPTMPAPPGPVEEARESAEEYPGADGPEDTAPEVSSGAPEPPAATPEPTPSAEPPLALGDAPEAPEITETPAVPDGTGGDPASGTVEEAEDTTDTAGATDPGGAEESGEGAAADTPCAEARRREGHRRDNDLWDMRPLDLDADPSTEMSSSARWELPEGGEVRWAGLYLSGVGAPDGEVRARLRGPGQDAYADVVADEVAGARLPAYDAYQAFADVTAQVREHGAGEWWVADVPTRTGVGTYAGWSLVVVLEDSTEPYNQAMVLDTTRTVFQDPEGVRVRLAGLLPAAAPARFDVVAWEGDVGLAGDRVLLGELPLTPLHGERDPDNAFVSHAAGAVGPQLTFGTDVTRFSADLPPDPELRLVSGPDAYLAGVVAITAAVRS